MSLIEYSRRRTDVEDAVRSDDSALNVFFVILLITFALGSLCFRESTDPIAATTSGSSSTVTEPVTSSPTSLQDCMRTTCISF
jgi:hypothetical protein